MTRPAPDFAKMHSDRIARAEALVERDLVLRLELAMADPAKARAPGLTPAQAMGVA